MTNTKQTQDDRTIQPFNRSTIQRVKAYAFTLAETLIVIGIIGVVAALTLPNLNHATGDKETVTRVNKIYSTLVDATDRAVVVYGKLSEWKNQGECSENLAVCYAKRISEFLKVSKTCFNGDENFDNCEPEHDCMHGWIEAYITLSDGTLIGIDNMNEDCGGTMGLQNQYKDICIDAIIVDINGVNKGKNEYSYDTFSFMVSDSEGFLPRDWEDSIQYCKVGNDTCARWVLDFGNLDYLKADEDGKCNDNPSIILDGVNNTSCH